MPGCWNPSGVAVCSAHNEALKDTSIDIRDLVKAKKIRERDAEVLKTYLAFGECPSVYVAPKSVNYGVRQHLKQKLQPPYPRKIRSRVMSDACQYDGMIYDELTSSSISNSKLNSGLQRNQQSLNGGGSLDNEQEKEEGKESEFDKLKNDEDQEEEDNVDHINSIIFQHKPPIPNVDTYVKLKGARYSSMIEELRAARAALVPQSAGMRRRQREKEEEESEYIPGTNHKKSDIQLVMKYLKQGTSGAEIELPHLETAFRKARRVKAVRQINHEGSELVWKLLTLVNSIEAVTILRSNREYGYTPPKLAQEEDADNIFDQENALKTLNKTSIQDGEPGFIDLTKWYLRILSEKENGLMVGRLFKVDIAQAIRKMNDEMHDLIYVKDRQFKKNYDIKNRNNPILYYTEEETDKLLWFIDPDQNGYIDLEEVQDAMVRIKTPPKILEEQARVGTMLDEFEKIMEKRRMRLIDLFRDLDTDHSGAVSEEELKEGLVRAAMPSAKERALRLKKERQEKEASANRAQQDKLRDMMKERFKRAKESGALGVMIKLEKYLHKHKLRVKDMFSKSGFDKSGDGAIDLDELMVCFKILDITATKKEAMQILNYLDINGDQLVQTSELEQALRELKQAKSVLMSKQESEKAQEAEISRKKKLEEERRQRVENVSAVRRFSEMSTTSLPSLKEKPNVSYQVFTGDLLDLTWLDSIDKTFERQRKKLQLRRKASLSKDV